ncbi:MAG: Rrf2 family transcriptional regulator [Planctomycetes bacterium]|nr:Rrf2 family transcriptional regulator [Planctomycetota bacterium]
MWLSVQSNYGLHVSVVMALSHPKKMSAIEISRILGLSRPFTLKILRLLKNGGIVRAIRGKDGGFTPAKRLCEITLFEIILSFEDLNKYERYKQRQSRCFSIECPMHSFWSDITDQIFSKLKSTTLQTLVDFYAQKGVTHDELRKNQWFQKTA